MAEVGAIGLLPLFAAMMLAMLVLSGQWQMMTGLFVAGAGALFLLGVLRFFVGVQTREVLVVPEAAADPAPVIRVIE